VLLKLESRFRLAMCFIESFHCKSFTQAQKRQSFKGFRRYVATIKIKSEHRKNRTTFQMKGGP